jgi:glucosyl-3-phosphoglycerate synthase
VIDPPLWTFAQPLEADWAGSVRRLVQLKRASGLRISVCLPALNEEATVGSIAREIRPLLEVGLVDQLAVIDSGSTDSTLKVASRAGAEVFEAAQILPGVAAPGKGGTLWKSLSVLTGDIVLWLDSDTRNFEPSFAIRLIAPFLEEPAVRMTKAFYDRPLEDGSGVLTTGGARVTELVVRPLSHLLFPELTGFVQPLSGEYAGYRLELVELPFFTGYGVEVGLLIDFIDRYGTQSIRQVDLGSRVHRNQDVPALGRMAFQVMQVMSRRAEDLGRLKVVTEWPETMTQFVSEDPEPTPVHFELPVIELPPIKTFL